MQCDATCAYSHNIGVLAMSEQIINKLDINFISIFSENKKETVQLSIPLVKYNTFGNQQKVIPLFEEGVTNVKS
jgi:hypothetical protein